MNCCDMVDAFLNFFAAMAKRELFIWKRKHEAMLLREVLVEEPHKYRPGSKERGISWTKIAEHLQESGMKVTQRSAREKFDKLYQDFKKREKEESRASGVDVEYDEIYQALTNIHDQIADWQEQQQGKEESEKATAEEMRKRATEKLSETKRRASTDDEENADGTCATPKKRKSHTSVTELLERSIERKASEQAEQQVNKKRELELRAEELRQQQQFQTMLLQQQQQFQQQQQHFQQQQHGMNMAMLNALAEIVKKFN